MFFKWYAERISKPSIQPACEDLKWFVKSMFDECKDEGRMGRQTAGETSASEPRREEPVCAVGGIEPGGCGREGRGGLGMAGNGTRLGSSLCTVLLFSAQN